VNKKIRILVADDEPEIRELFITLTKAHPKVEVVGTATDGQTAVELNKVLNPDIIIMDLHMPHTDGIEAIKRIMATHPKPIIVLSGYLDSSKIYSRLSSLMAGAIDVMEKPFSMKTLLKKIELLSEIKLPQRPKETNKKKYEMIVIGASTGGPEVIKTILKPLPARFPFYIAIAQHISKGQFDKLFIDYLQSHLKLKVELAKGGEKLKKGIVYVAPADANLEIRKNVKFALNHNQTDYVPSIDTLFQSAAHVFGAKTIAILLTGMGEDGVKGLKAIKEAGGITIAQDKNSCVVFGMPRRAIELGLADKVLTPNQISQLLLHYSKQDNGN